jgi:DNA-binding MarR family transcriptional regulator
MARGAADTAVLAGHDATSVDRPVDDYSSGLIGSLGGVQLTRLALPGVRLEAYEAGPQVALTARAGPLPAARSLTPALAQSKSCFMQIESDQVPAAESDQEWAAEPDTGAEVAALEAMTRLLVRMAWSSAHTAPSGVTFSQFRALLALHELGVVPSSRLAAALEVNASSITRLADKLEHHGHLTRGRRAGNRGVVTLALTDAGRAVVTEVLDRRHAALGAVLAEMSPWWRRRVAAGARRFTATAVAMGAGQANGSYPL